LVYVVAVSTIAVLRAGDARHSMSAATRQPGREDSRGAPPSQEEFQLSSALRTALAVAAFVGPALLIVADLSTLIEIRVLTVSQKTISGGSHHAYALLVIGLFCLPMAWGAIRGGSRPATIALAALGGVALIIVLAIDLPDIHKTGVIGKRFTDASASPKTGFYLETLGALLLLLAGSARLVLQRRSEVEDSYQR
jgi:hypothetical protein